MPLCEYHFISNSDVQHSKTFKIILSMHYTQSVQLCYHECLYQVKDIFVWMIYTVMLYV